MVKAKKKDLPRRRLQKTLDDVAQERYAVQSRQPHATVTKDKNPFCPTCGWRTYPLWGEHRCKQKASEHELQRIRNFAGQVVSNLHFYRFGPPDQVAILCIALGHILGRNAPTQRAIDKWTEIIPYVTRVIRQQEGHAPSGDVAAIMGGPLKAKKRR